MKRFFILLSFIICNICAWADLYDQRYFDDAFVVQLEEAGTLSKILGKNINSITSLQIQGNMSDKDMKSLAKLTNLKKLNLRYSNIENTKYFPSLAILEVLYLPENFQLSKEYVNMVTANNSLKVLLVGLPYIGEGYLDNSVAEEIIFTSTNLIFEERALKGRKELKKIEFSSSISNLVIPNACFADCPNLKTIDFDSPVTIKTFAFGNKTSNHITKVTFNAPAKIESNGLSFVDTIVFNVLPTYLESNFSDFAKISTPLNQNWIEPFFEWGIIINPEIEEIMFANPKLDLKSMNLNLFEKLSKLRKVTFSNTIENLDIPLYSIPKCPSLQFVVFDCPVSISEGAFSKQSIQKMVFNAPANIGADALYHVDTLVFNALPTNLRNNFAHYNTIITPTGQDWAGRFAEWGISIDPEKEEFVFTSPNQTMHSSVLACFPKLKKVVFANTLGNCTIPSNAFVDCPAIETMVFDCPVILERWAFAYNIDIGEVIFNEQVTIRNGAFYGEASSRYRNKAPIGKVIFNSSANIENYAFIDTRIDEMVFNTMPEELPENFAICRNIQIPNVEGAYDIFVSWGIPGDYLMDPSANLDLDVVVTEPGNILKYLPIDKLRLIKSLTITGRLYETDIAILKGCTNLEYLNLSKATISESPKSKERRKYSDPMPDCFIPSEAFKDMRLKTVVLPRKLKAIYRNAFKGCKSLQNVDLGESLITIGANAFENTQLVEVNFPITLKEIFGNAFENVRNLKVLDLSQCSIKNYLTVSELNSNLGEMPDLEVFYMPNGITTCAAFFFYADYFGGECPKLKDFYVGKDVKSIDRKIRGINLHFQSELAPELGMFSEVSDCTIYVPKNGNITSYYAVFNGNGNKIIQE